MLSVAALADYTALMAAKVSPVVSELVQNTAKSPARGRSDEEYSVMQNSGSFCAAINIHCATKAAVVKNQDAT